MWSDGQQMYLDEWGFKAKEAAEASAALIIGLGGFKYRLSKMKIVRGDACELCLAETEAVANIEWSCLTWSIIRPRAVGMPIIGTESKRYLSLLIYRLCLNVSPGLCEHVKRLWTFCDIWHCKCHELSRSAESNAEKSLKIMNNI